MEHEFWQKQSIDKPLFPELLWSRPENKRLAGKLLIVGGNLHGFSTVAGAYRSSQAAGVGANRVLLPNSLQKIVSQLFPEADFAPSNPSGSFAEKALADFLTQAEWADGVLLAGDFGRNSETTILLENFINKFSGQLTIANDTIDSFTQNNQAILERSNTTLILSPAQLQKLAVSSSFAKAFTSNLELLQLVERLHEFSGKHQANIITNDSGRILVATNGNVSSTTMTNPYGKTDLAAYTAVWWIQNPAKTFEALTSAIVDLNGAILQS